MAKKATPGDQQHPVAGVVGAVKRSADEGNEVDKVQVAKRRRRTPLQGHRAHGLGISLINTSTPIVITSAKTPAANLPPTPRRRLQASYFAHQPTTPAPPSPLVVDTQSDGSIALSPSTQFASVQLLSLPPALVVVSPSPQKPANLTPLHSWSTSKAPVNRGLLLKLAATRRGNSP